MGGGGGGDNGMGMMMMIAAQQNAQRQAEEQARRLAAEQAAREKQYADNSRGRYNTLLTKQNKTLGDMYASYNKNIDDIMAIDPEFTAGKKLDFANYDYETPGNFGAADVNTVDNWYSQLDAKSFDDQTAFKKTLDQSNVWLNAAKQKQDILGRNLPGTPVGAWGGGGQQVSGGAGADSLDPNAAIAGNAIGDPTANQGVYNIAGGASAAQTPGAGTGFLADDSSKSSSNLAGMFGNAVTSGTPKKTSSSYSMF